MTARLRLAQGLLALGTLFVCLLLLEGALRVLGLFPPKTQYSRFVEHDPQRGWRNVPGASGWLTTDEFHVALEYNERAYRGPLYAYGKRPEVRRVVMLGDSFVEGFTVAREQRVSERLAALLSDSAAPVEVVPLGTGGYGTDQQLLWLESEGLRYDPDLVVVMFYYNDVWHNTASVYSLGAKPKFEIAGDSLRLTNVPVPLPTPRASTAGLPRRVAVWFSEHTHLGALGSRAVKSSSAIRAVASTLGLVDTPAAAALATGEGVPLLDELRVFARDTQPEVEQAWLATERLLREIRRQAAGRGAELVLFHIPFRFSLDSQDGALPEEDPLRGSKLDFSRVAGRFTAMCARLEVRCIEPTSEFQAASRRRRDRLYFEYDWHWTAAGHALAARLLADSIAARDSVAPVR